MLEHLIQYTHSDKRYNEDVSAVGNDYMFVIDGATGLGANDVMGCGDDARWFAQTMKEHIQKHIHDELPLTEIVCQAIRDTRSRYRQDVEKMKKIDMPSGCIALFRLKDKKLEFFGLGDTCGVIELRDGQILMIADERLEALDHSVIQEMVRISAERGIPLSETRPFVKDQLIYNRNLRNTEKGYYALDLTEAGPAHAFVRTWPVESVRRIACMSDGFSQILDYPGHHDLSALLDAIEADHEQVARQLYDLQEEDSACRVVPRLKKRDDATMTFAKIC